MDKVLIIGYYWPPSGGAGVQRWLKLSKYLQKSGIEVHVITVDEQHASYMQIDESLLKEVNPEVTVHKTNSFEPINMYSKLVGKKNVPTAGYSNVAAQSWKQRLVSSIRSHIFIPDPRKGWNAYAYKKAVEVIDTHGIKTVITTSPPHSSQLIGLKLKKKYKDALEWVADFRDPWTDIYYYPLLNHSRWSHRKNARYEKNVIEQCDKLITVGQDFIQTLQQKTDKHLQEKSIVIPNGFDLEDFNKVSPTHAKQEVFQIMYTGTLSDHYKPEVVFDAIHDLIQEHPDKEITLTMVGIVSPTLKKYINDTLGGNANFVPPVAHSEAINYMKSADVLLLVTQGEEGTIPGKTFEYLASGSPILCIGSGDAAETVEGCNAGKAFNRTDVIGIKDFLEKLVQGEKLEPNDQLYKFSREHQASALASFLG